MAENEALTLRVMKGHCLGGARGDVFPGAILKVPGDLTPVEAKRRLGLGYVEVIENGEPDDDTRAPVVAPGEIVDADPEPETRDPKPAQKRTRKPRARMRK